MNCWMVSQFSGGTVSSEEIWSCFIEILLIGFKVNACEFVMGGLEVILLNEASSSNFGV